MADNQNEPVWFKFVPRPDLVSIVSLALLAMAWHILDLVAHYPALATNEIFKTLAILLVGTGGLGLAISFIYGGSKAGVAAADTVNTMARASGSGPGGGTVTTPPLGGTLVTTTTTAPAPASTAAADMLAAIAGFTTRSDLASWLADGSALKPLSDADFAVVTAAISPKWESLPADGSTLIDLTRPAGG